MKNTISYTHKSCGKAKFGNFRAVRCLPYEYDTRVSYHATTHKPASQAKSLGPGFLSQLTRTAKDSIPLCPPTALQEYGSTTYLSMVGSPQSRNSPSEHELRFRKFGTWNILVQYRGGSKWGEHLYLATQCLSLIPAVIIWATSTNKNKIKYTQPYSRSERVCCGGGKLAVSFGSGGYHRKCFPRFSAVVPGCEVQVFALSWPPTIPWFITITTLISKVPAAHHYRSLDW